MIIIGYQGIGKSSLALQDDKYIDLESGNFWIDGKRDENWYKPYIHIADHLSMQNYFVFVSSHEVVRKYLAEYTHEEVISIVPAIQLKDSWIQKLKDRYEKTHLNKDYKAWKNAEDRYEANIQEIVNSGFPCCQIRNMNYCLKDVVRHYIADSPLKEDPCIQYNQ